MGVPARASGRVARTKSTDLARSKASPSLLSIGQWKQPRPESRSNDRHHPGQGSSVRAKGGRAAIMRAFPCFRAGLLWAMHYPRPCIDRSGVTSVDRQEISPCRPGKSFSLPPFNPKGVVSPAWGASCCRFIYLVNSPWRMARSYQLESSRSRPITEDKLVWVRVVVR